MKYKRQPRQPATSSNRTRPKRVSQSQPDAEGFPTLKPGKATFNIANIPVNAPPQESSQHQEIVQPVLTAQAVTVPTGALSMSLWEFMKREIVKRSPALASKVAGLSLVDGALPIGDLISLGLTLWTLKEIYDAYQVHMSTSESASESTSEGEAEERVYEPSEKHGSEDRGNISREPTDGQEALDNSVQVKETSTRRVGVDEANDEIVVLDETHPGKEIFHGHVRTWDKLTSQMQNALKRAGLVNKRGRIIKK